MATLCYSGGACGGGGATGSDFLLSGHDEITRHLVEKIDNCISDAFNVCRIEMQVYESTAAEFCEVSRIWRYLFYKTFALHIHMHFFALNFCYLLPGPCLR